MNKEQEKIKALKEEIKKNLFELDNILHYKLYDINNALDKLIEMYPEGLGNPYNTAHRVIGYYIADSDDFIDRMNRELKLELRNN